MAYEYTPPKYAQVIDELRRRIEAGQYPPDTRIPTESELMEAFEVARTTARRAIAVNIKSKRSSNAGK